VYTSIRHVFTHSLTPHSLLSHSALTPHSLPHSLTPLSLSTHSLTHPLPHNSLTHSLTHSRSLYLSISLPSPLSHSFTHSFSLSPSLSLSLYVHRPSIHSIRLRKTTVRSSLWPHKGSGRQKSRLVKPKKLTPLNPILCSPFYLKACPICTFPLCLIGSFPCTSGSASTSVPVASISALVLVVFPFSSCVHVQSNTVFLELLHLCLPNLSVPLT
jgi:hypothetical protein